MAIKSYVPKKSMILDRRSAEGGYYIAECEECKREFYPKNAKARFCSSECRSHNYLKHKTPQTQQKKVVNTNTSPVKNDSLTLLGQKDVINYFKKVEKEEMDGSVGVYRDLLKDLAVNEKLTVGEHVVKRITAKKYEIKKSS